MVSLVVFDKVHPGEGFQPRISLSGRVDVAAVPRCLAGDKGGGAF